MNCAVHADAEASGYCRNCGKAMCPQCARDVRGALYCEDCLGKIVGTTPGQAQASANSGPNPGLAALLGFIPGLGAVYNGEYVKAIIHVVIFGSLIAIHNSEMNAGDVSGGNMAFIHVAIACFYFYMPIDSYRVAKARRQGIAKPEPVFETAGHVPIGAIILILVGVLFLLSNFGLLREDWFSKAWPLGLIALGIYMLWTRLDRKA
jgi:Domain of unknown function (DUF5668)/B-box zinc finger